MTGVCLASSKPTIHDNFPPTSQIINTEEVLHNGQCKEHLSRESVDRTFEAYDQMKVGCAN